MTPTGRHRAWPVVRPRQPAAFAALALMLLILAASLLVSAGSDHHRPGAAPTLTAAVTAAVGGDLAVAHPVSGHEHRHGNDWTPHVGKRLRPAADLTVVHVTTAGPSQPDTTMSATTAFPAAFSPSGDLTLLGVLRI